MGRWHRSNRPGGRRACRGGFKPSPAHRSGNSPASHPFRRSNEPLCPPRIPVEHVRREWVSALSCAKLVCMEIAGRITSIDRARNRVLKRRPKGLTESERQLLLAEVAKISAELCDLQVWAAE